MRRASPITLFSVAAAHEAAGAELEAVRSGALRTGIVFCVLSGCVNYSRRFFAETLESPATASPLIFPETVFNAPASHLGAFLKSLAINYTLVGDQSTFLQGLALGGFWLAQNLVDRCLVVAAEEIDWVTSTASNLFSAETILSEGAAAVYLAGSSAGGAGVCLEAITSPLAFQAGRTRREAAVATRAELDRWRGASPGAALLCDGRQRVRKLDAAEEESWREWRGPRQSPKMILGEAMVAAAGWQCVLAIDALAAAKFEEAIVSVVGSNEHAIAALFRRSGLAQGTEPGNKTHA